ncbi:MAG TPA: polysaccharide biosynthesis/export family protein [Opitutaceae bacterium]|nr:polysaccharide biosynthesis/export family protein [Opitutaceae bacterium]
MTTRRSFVLRCAFALGAMIAVFSFAGCDTAPTASTATFSGPPPQMLGSGDVIHLSFPGAPAMDTTQQIRRDGKLNLNLVGEVQAAGKTPSDLEKELSSLYATQIVSKEVKVTVVSSSFSIFVTGAVVKPGKIQPDHALTAFEAIMEAGGFDYDKANTKAVRVIRNEAGTTKSYTLNLQAVLDGKSVAPFYLQSNDTIYVPEKFQWF